MNSELETYRSAYQFTSEQNQGTSTTIDRGDYYSNFFKNENTLGVSRTRNISFFSENCDIQKARFQNVGILRRVSTFEISK